MSIFYNHIKGCGVGSTGEAESKTDLWTWIQMAPVSTEKPEQIENKKDAEKIPYFKFAPSILVGNSNNKTETANFGHIITENGRDQIINNNFTFKAKTTLTDLAVTGIAKVGNALGFYSNVLIADKDPDIKEKYRREQINFGSLNKKDDQDNNYSKWKAAILFQDQTGLSLQVTQSDENYKTMYLQSGVEHNFIGGPLIVQDNKCEALYFNATSDRRAKTNIYPSYFKGLDIVNALPIYNFNYLSNQASSIGIMAQDAVTQDLGNFNLVDNINASGKDGDYMSIKESKLVYVLWKAVQELSDEVEELKAQLNK